MSGFDQVFEDLFGQPPSPRPGSDAVKSESKKSMDSTDFTNATQAESLTGESHRQTSFRDVFGDPPRPQQVTALDDLAAVEPADVVVAEGPTGIGKSRIAVMHAIHMLEKTSTLRRIVYACHTRKLQTQLAKDARRWTLEASPAFATRPARMTCVFGTSNYWCKALLEHEFRSEPPDTKRKRVLQQLCAFDTMENAAYDVPFEDHFLEICRECEFDNPEHRDHLRSRIFCSKRCGCYDAVRKTLFEERIPHGLSTDWREMLEAIEPRLKCPYARSRLLSRLSTVVIVNSHYLFTSLGCGNETAFHPALDYLVLDEAHSLADGPILEYCKQQLPPNLVIREINDVLRRWNHARVTRSLLKLANDTQLIEEKPFLDRSGKAKSTPPFQSPGIVDTIRTRCRLCIDVSTLESCHRFISDVLAIEKTIWTALEKRKGSGKRPHEEVSPEVRLKAAFVAKYNSMLPHLMPLHVDELLLAVPDPMITEATRDENGRDPRVLTWLKNAKREAMRLFTGEKKNEEEDEEDEENEQARARREQISQLLSSMCTLAQCADPFSKEVKQELTEAIKVLEAIHVARISCNRSEWTGDRTRRLMAPGATPEGIFYDPTAHMIRHAFRKLLWKHERMSLLLMSATLTSAEFAETDPFRCFRAETGLFPPEEKKEQDDEQEDEQEDEEDDVRATRARKVHYFRFQEPFDRRRVDILSPRMKINFNFARMEEDPAYAQSFMREQIRHILPLLKAMPEPKSALVLSGNLSETDRIREELQSLHPERVHFAYRSGDTRFRDFEADLSARAVIYGADGLTTGVDLPNRIGLVVILKPFNKRAEDHLHAYQEKVLGDIRDDIWTMYWYKRDRIHAQAAGRIQRCAQDEGTLLILSDKHEHDPHNRHKGAAFRLKQLWRLPQGN